MDNVESFLPEPTFLLSFLTLSLSISSTLHLFPTHDDTFLPTYPILLFLLPIITTRSTARGVHPQSSQQQFMVYNPSQQLSVVSQPSGVHPQPNHQQVVAYPPPLGVKLSLSQQQVLAYSSW